MHIAPLGDAAVVITVGAEVNEHTHRLVGAIHERLERAPVAGQIECVPAFASVVVHYDPARVARTHPRGLPSDIVTAAIERMIADIRERPVRARRTVEIPVCYGGQFGPDLDEVARAHDLAPAQVVEEHASGEYIVYMIGFLPGFPYLGGLSPRLATPRRDTPRAIVPAGSVGIGGSQTGVYPLDSPGGWHIIGRTPLALFSPHRQPPALLQADDAVRFRPISVEELERLRADAE